MSRAICASFVALGAVLAQALPAAAQTFLKKDVNGWVQELNADPKETGRRNAAFALGKMGMFAVEAVPPLHYALDKDASAKVRDAAAFALGEIARECMRVLADAKADSENARALAKAITDPRLAPILMKALGDDAWQVRRSAAFALGCLERDDKDVQLALEQALRDKTPQVRQNAAWALGRVGAAAAPKLREALRDQDVYVKRDAAQSLGLFEPLPVRAALGDLLTLCEDDNSEVRRAAVSVLIRIVGAEDAKLAAEPLQRVLKDADEEIRRNAALALANIGGKEAAQAVPVLIDALVRGDLELRRQAAAAFRNIGPEGARAVPELMRGLRDPDQEMRKNAAVALGGIGPPAEKAVPALVQLLLDAKDHEEPRVAAAGALSRIGPVPAAIDALPQILGVIGNSSDKSMVRLRSIWAIRVHDRALGKMEGVYPALSKVFKEPKTEDNRMLRHDCAYMLGMLQRGDVRDDVMDALLDFLKDDTVLVYETTRSSLQGAGIETGAGKANIKESGKGDGRVMATQALKDIGVARLKQRPDIIRQLQALDIDPATLPDLKKDCRVILKALGK